MDRSDRIDSDFWLHVVQGSHSQQLGKYGVFSSVRVCSFRDFANRIQNIFDFGGVGTRVDRWLSDMEAGMVSC